MFPEDDFSTDDDAWDPSKDATILWSNMNSCCVAYIDGGNALMLFDSSKTDKRVEVVKNFTCKLLAERLGLKVGAALDTLKLIDGKLGASDEKFYSQETAVKFKFAESADKNLRERFKKIFKLKKFEAQIDFPSEVEKLGQKEGENYFEIIHVDGNNMGLKFRTRTSLKAETPEDAPEHLTGKFSRHMDACAGIAILPTKYPFFRGYELAEQLCDEAKEPMCKLSPKKTSAEEIIHGSSWLDFAILHGEQAPTLEQIRANEYRGAQGSLHFGAYRLCNDDAEFKRDRLHNVENLLDCTTKFLQQLHYQGQDLPDVPNWDNFKKNL